MVRAMFVVLAFVSGTVYAQVYRCPDPVTGKLTYSDAACASGGVQLERKRSQAEIEYDRQRAASAYQRFQAEQRRDAERELNAQRRTYQQPQQATSQAGRSMECTRAKGELEIAASRLTGSKESRDTAIAAANRKVDLECFGGADAANIRAAEAGATKVEITNHHYDGWSKRCDKKGDCW